MALNKEAPAAEHDDLAFSKLGTDDDVNKDQDDAGKFIAQVGGAFEYTAKEANIVRWKLDLILLPMVCLLIYYAGLCWLTQRDDDYVSLVVYGQGSALAGIYIWHSERRCK